MRELSAGGHKLRRPSFSNTLSELPEVEEPDCLGESQCYALEGSTTVFKVLPPIQNEDISPSPRPRFNTIPEGVTERPKYNVKIKAETTDSRQSPVKEKLHQRHSYPGRTSHFQTLDQELAGPHKSKMSKRKKSCRENPRRSSFSGDNHANDTNRRPSLTVPPIQKCNEVLPSSANKSQSSNSKSVTEVLKESVESVHKTEAVYDNDALKKDSEIIKWRKALDKVKTKSPYGSFEDLAGSLEDCYRSRRFSMPLDTSWDRRFSNPAFADTSRKVDILLKYGKAVRNRYGNAHSTNKSLPSKTIRTLADFVIEMPKRPRFSSFMSPEAQYSLMKGYEDKLYRKLSSSLPEYNPLLKRNKTPKNTSVDIKPKNTLDFLDDSDGDDDDDNGENDETVKSRNEDHTNISGSFLTQIDDESSNAQSSPRTVRTDSVSSTCESQYPDAKTVLRNFRRLSISLGKSSRASINKSFHDEHDDEEDICSTLTTRQRSHSMPSVSSVPFQRRLMMSYRLQSAMDILDNIKAGEDTKLSPRLRPKRGADLTEYNTWVADWNKEFCLKSGHD